MKRYRRSATWPTLGALALVACGPARPPATHGAATAAPVATPTTPPVVPVAPSASVPGPPSPPPATEIELGLPGDEATACRLSDPSWHGPLAFEPGGEPFARAIEGHAEIALPRSGTNTWASFASEGVRLAAWVGEVKVHLARARAIGRIAYPFASTALTWEGAGRAAAVAVSVDVSEALAAPPVLREEVPCKDLTLQQADFDVRARFPAALPDNDLYLTEEAPLSDTPGGAPSGRLRFDGAEITPVAERGAAVQIIVRLDAVLLGGWVPRKAFTREARGFGLTGMGEGMATPRAGYSLPNSEAPQCPHDLPLFVEARGRRAEVGVLVAETPIVGRATAARTDGFVAIALVGKQWLALVPGAAVLVRRADLDRCRP